MTTYRGIKGLGIQSITSDAVASQAAGGTWASGNSLNTKRQYGQGAGNSSAAIAVGGRVGTNPSGASIVRTVVLLSVTAE